MIRQLAQCPYCQGCEVALTDNLDIVFNPERSPSAPCAHLIWIEGRYSQWERSPLPGRKTKIARMIGSTEFEWQHPGLMSADDANAQLTYLKELVAAGAGWEFAPPAEHTVRPISLDQSTTDADGKVYPNWEIEGATVFARNAPAFMESVPACMVRRHATWTELPEGFDFQNQ